LERGHGENLRMEILGGWVCLLNGGWGEFARRYCGIRYDCVVGWGKRENEEKGRGKRREASA
jgi:hypothetical protein